jgi:hypothetical protein
VSARRQLNDLPDELWTKINIEFYKDGADAVFKALVLKSTPVLSQSERYLKKYRFARKDKA